MRSRHVQSHGLTFCASIQTARTTMFDRTVDGFRKQVRELDEQIVSCAPNKRAQEQFQVLRLLLFS